jgi:hypothetical protein
MLVMAVGMWMATAVQDLHRDGGLGLSEVFATVITIFIGVGGLSALAGFFVAVFIGLLKMRKDLKKCPVPVSK